MSAVTIKWLNRTKNQNLEQKAACADANIYSVMARAGQNHGKELLLK